MSQAQLLPSSPAPSFPPLTYQGIPVLTTDMLARAYGVEEHQIRQNFKNNRERFIEGKHFFSVSGQKLKDFRLCVENFYSQISPKVRVLVLWTDRGCARHAKSLNTDKAWDMYELLEETFFAVVKPTAQAAPLTPSTVSDREPLRAIVNAWSRISGQPQNNLWPQVRAAFNITNIKQLPAEWVSDAIAWVQEKIDALPKALPESEPAAYPLLTLTPQFRTELESLLREIPAWGERVYRERIRYTVRLQVLTHACMRESERDALLLRSLDRAIDNMMSRIGNASAEYVREGGNPAALISHLAASVGQM